MIGTRLPAVLLAGAALALGAGCGGGGESSGGGGGGEQQATGEPRKVFADTCGGCHALEAAGTKGQVGPNLDELGPDAQTVISAIRRGPSIMPENLLQGAAADEVAQWVADNAAGG